MTNDLLLELMQHERQKQSEQSQEREGENSKQEEEEEQIGCISDLYHQNVNQPQKSNILFNNVAEIMLIPNHSDVKGFI